MIDALNKLFATNVINYNVFVNNIVMLLRNSNRFLNSGLRNLQLNLLEICHHEKT